MRGPHCPLPGELAEPLMRPDSVPLLALTASYMEEHSHCQHPPLPLDLAPAMPAEETKVGDLRPMLSRPRHHA